MLQRAIIKQVHKREELTFSRFSCFSKDALRLNPEREKISDSDNIRPAFFHDIDRIIHSRAYTRYMDKTQVFSLFKNQHITHRSLHVQLVSKIARTIGRSLALNEDLIEAIALAHDLGHPPFGHDGEFILNDICRKEGIGAFAHNAQSVRSLMSLENKGRGLNITLQVLDGVLAHNGEMLSEEYRPDRKKDWNMFVSELELSYSEQDYSKKIVPMTLEGCVVRISDIIAYIGRDIEDAIHLNLLKRSDIPAEINDVLGDENSKIVNVLVTDIIRESYSRDCLGFSKKVHRALQSLKKFNYKEIYFNPVIKRESKKIKRMFYLLYDLYCTALDEEDRSSHIYTYYLKEQKIDSFSKEQKKRIVIDYMASMTDNFIINEFNEFFFPQRFGYFVKGE